MGQGLFLNFLRFFGEEGNFVVFCGGGFFQSLFSSFFCGLFGGIAVYCVFGFRKTADFFVFLGGERVEGEVKSESEGGLVDGAQGKGAVLDGQGRPAAFGLVVKVGMALQDLVLKRGIKGGEAGAVVMAVAFYGLDAEAGHDGEVLQKGDRALIAQVFAADNPLFDGRLAGVFFDEATVSDSFENAFAVFVAGAVVAEF